MFHFTPRRIEAHVCICFVALKVYKELERLLKLSGCPYSVDETLKIAETIVTIEIARPENKDTITKTLCLTEEERAIAYLIDTDDWLELWFGWRNDKVRNNLNKYVGFNLSIPIFNRFSTRNRVRTARLQQIDLSLRLDNAKKALYKEIQQAWYNALAAESKYNSSEVAVKANEESFRLMSEKFNNGKATFVEYNEAKLNLTRALSDKLQAKYDYLFRTKILDFYKGQVIE